MSAVLLQKRTGGNLAEILDKLAYVIRERFKLRGRIRAISAHGKMTGIALTCIPIGVGVIMFFVNPDYVKFFFEDELGNIMLGCRDRVSDRRLPDYQEDCVDRGLTNGTAADVLVVRRASWATVTVIGLEVLRSSEGSHRARRRCGGRAAGHIPAHPSLAFRELLQKLGDVLPASPKDVTIMQRRLIRAGFRGQHALKVLYGSKLALS